MNQYLRPGPPGYFIDPKGRLIPESQVEVKFGGGFTPAELGKSGVISSFIAVMLGAGLPGALVMGIGSMIVEAGSGQIPAGWKRYVLGLFRKPNV